MLLPLTWNKNPECPNTSPQHAAEWSTILSGCVGLSQSHIVRVFGHCVTQYCLSFIWSNAGSPCSSSLWNLAMPTAFGPADALNCRMTSVSRLHSTFTMKAGSLDSV
ncbi:hypothetical protein Pelo_5879 [Pelomyxa schiedti]|nr:hypothetical protein Pelo_5879 [Pelomyxa schiedti]